MIMRRMNITGLLVLLTLIPFYIPELLAQIHVTHDRETLRGLKGFYVLIEEDDGITQAGLTEKILRTYVELKLRKAGLRVLTIDEMLLTLGRPHLYVSVNAIELKSRREFIYSVNVAFKQDVILFRKGSNKTSGVTWGKNRFLGTTPETNAWRNIREAVSILVDQFMNDYLAVNPK